jgi:hypothetical protein
MVSPSNQRDETCGGILSKDFGFRAAMRGRDLGRCRVMAGEMRR